MQKLLRTACLCLALVGGTFFCADANKAYAAQNDSKTAVTVYIDSSEAEQETTVHSFSKWQTFKAATCTEAGEMRRLDENSDIYMGKQIPALGHSYNTSTVNATYFGEGYTLHKCKRCGNEYKTEVKPKLTLAKPVMSDASSDEKSVTVTWNKVKNASGYRLYRYNTSSKKWEITATLGNVLKYTDTSRSSNTKYAYTVKAYVKNGSKYAWSVTADCIWVMTAPAKASLNVVGANYSAKLSWAKVSGAEGYKLYYKKHTDTSYKALAISKQTSYNVKNLLKDTKYDFCIRTYNTYKGKTNLSSKVIVSADILGGLYDKKTINVTNILQMPLLPTGCEITSLTILLRHYGYNVDIMTMEKNFLSKQNFWWSGGAMYGADLDEAFAGDPESYYGYGCFSGAIVKAGNSYLSAVKSSLKAYQNKGVELDTLLTDYINYDKPVLIWITSDGLLPVSYSTYWYTSSGKVVYWPNNEHCVVLTGYDSVKKLIYVSDPLEGNVAYDYSKLKQRYNDLGKQSVYIK